MAIETDNDEKSQSSEKQCKGCCWFSMSTSKINQQTPSTDSLLEKSYTVQDESYCHQLPSPLAAGNYIMLKGTIRENCLRFCINFKCDNSGQNIAFHLNPRLEQKYAVRNSKVNGYWGSEETTSMCNFNFAAGKRFRINIVVTNEEFLVSVNDKHFCGFSHRIPFKQITMIEVEGEVDISSLEITNIMTYPAAKPEQLFTIPFDSDYDVDNSQEFEMPFTGVLPKGFQNGWQLEIYGKVKILPHSFYINLQDGMQYWPHPIIPLHLNPRFSTSIGANTFVRNAWYNGTWGHEERAPVFPFNPGYSFGLFIRMEFSGYSIWVNGKLTAEFPYKTGTSEKIINTVYIQGDVKINHITMRKKISDTYVRNKNDFVVGL